MIDKIDVTGDRSFKYLREQLNMGISLSQIMNNLPIENGKVYAFVPQGINEESLYNFSYGGIYPFDKEELKTTNVIRVRNDAKKIILDIIEKHIILNEENCCLFEYPNAAPHDPWVATSGMNFIHLNNEQMFFFFDKRSCEIEKLQEAFSTSHTYIFLCVLSTLNINEHSHFAPFKEITDELLSLLVNESSSFFVRAYDGEGYLMWEKI